MKKILVLCTGNSCRSQIAEGYLRFFFGPRAEVYSAGIEAHGLNPWAVRTMAEDGIDISRHTSNLMEDYRSIDFDVVLTVCDHAKENCPFWPAQAERIHQNFPDPAKFVGTEAETAAEFRRVRNLIKEYCRSFADAGRA